MTTLKFSSERHVISCELPAVTGVMGTVPGEALKSTRKTHDYYATAPAGREDRQLPHRLAVISLARMVPTVNPGGVWAPRCGGGRRDTR